MRADLLLWRVFRELPIILLLQGYVNAKRRLNSLMVRAMFRWVIPTCDRVSC